MVGFGAFVVRGGTGWWLASVLSGGGSDLVPWVALGWPVFGWWVLLVQSTGGVWQVRSPMVAIGAESGW
jgi:hypothetical protein